MRRTTIAVLANTLLLLGLTLPVSAATAQTTNASLAITWLHGQQQSSGQIGPATGNPIARSAETAFSLFAAGQDAAAFKNGALSLADYLKAVTTTDVGTNGELVLARAVQPNAGPTAGPIAQLRAAYLQACASSAGEYGGDIFSDALAILGLRAAGQALGAETIAFLRARQNPTDHGWSFDNAGQFGSDSNTTALVIQALLAAGVPAPDTSVAGGLGFLGTTFQSGGFVFQAGSAPDAQSDELAIETIVAAGLQGNATWSPRLAAAQQNLASLQVASGTDSGALLGFDGKPSLMATTPAPAAFLLKPLTIRTSQAAGLPLACPHLVAATTPAPRLAQTGGGPPAAWLVLIALALVLAGCIVWRRPLRA
jgi:hypothetical protein